MRCPDCSAQTTKERVTEMMYFELCPACGWASVPVLLYPKRDEHAANPIAGLGALIPGIGGGR